MNRQAILNGEQRGRPKKAINWTCPRFPPKLKDDSSCSALDAACDFYAKRRQPMTSFTDPGRMVLFVNTD